MRTVRILFGVLLVAAVAGCQSQGAPAPAAAPAAAPTGPVAKPYATLAQMMRAIPFPNSNIIFDTQTKDPAAATKAVDKSSTAAAGGASGVYSSVYAGWQQVENSALALSETATLLMIPGRKCENGLPVPLEQENFRKAVQGLIEDLQKQARRPRVALVGHEPGLGELASRLAGFRHPIEFKKGAVCRIDVDALPPNATGTLRWFDTPKMLRSLRK